MLAQFKVIKSVFYYVAITLKMRCVLVRAGEEEKSKENSILDILGFVTLGNKNIDHLLDSYYVPGPHGSTGHHLNIAAPLVVTVFCTFYR